MNKTLSLISIIIIMISCSNGYKPRNISQVTIEGVEMDSVSIRAIYAVSENELYYAGSNGVISHTTDGGKSWTNIAFKYNDSIVPHFRSIASNGTSVFALSIESPALLYKIDGNESELVYTENDKAAFYDSMQFPDSQHGIAMGDPTDNCISILITSDGGNSWRKISCKDLPSYYEGEAAFAASNTNITTLESTVWIATGGKKARVLKSEDYGVSWVAYETPIVQGESTTGIYSIDFVDKNNGIIIGGDYSKPEGNKANKAITTDGGLTWKLVSEGKSPNYKSCVQYIPNTDGKEVVAVGKTGVSFSNDGGIIWKDISTEGYYAIQFVDENMAWLSGSEKIGKLYLSE